MKKALILLMGIVIGHGAVAQRITWQEAHQKAKQFLQKNSAKTRSSVELQTTGADTTQQNVYVFNTKGERGFVIIAGDKRLPDVLGYAEKGSLNRETAPCGLKWLLDAYSEMVERMPANFKPATLDVEHETVWPYVTTDWGQFNPYNDYCPELEGRPTAAGCVAVAMAMAINYTQWPEDSTKAIPGYVTETHKFVMDTLPPKKFRWKDMDRSEICYLMLYCGEAIKTDYMNGASTAYNSRMPIAMKKYFDYDQKTHIISRSNYTDEKWDSIIYEEVKNKRAVIYNAYTENYQGHNFIVNGFKDGYYYINWGWSGDCNGFFDLFDLQGGGYNFNFSQGAVIGIQPPTPETTAIEPVRERGQAADIYTLTGVKVRSNATSLDGLPKGIYLMNGRKVLVK